MEPSAAARLPAAHQAWALVSATGGSLNPLASVQTLRMAAHLQGPESVETSILLGPPARQPC